jgi:hypothetical protein
MQKLHEENEKLFDRLTEKSGLGSLPQVVPKFSLFYYYSLCAELIHFCTFILLIC